MENEKRTSFGSNLGFIMTAIGSAVGLGNIWGFPYKMGKCGGFSFLLVYLCLGLIVGMTAMVTELALGRKTGTGVVGAYKKVSKKYKWVGWLGLLSPLLIMGFYSVLGGYCIQYMCLNLAELGFGLSELFGGAITGSNTFGGMLNNQFGCAVFTALFLGYCMYIVMRGLGDGIEKFNKIGMPALYIMLLVVIVRALSLPNASEGLKFMFVPGYAVEAGFIEEAPSFISVLGIAGGQMFFSLSLAMGAMITYGSYLSKKENLVKNSVIIVFSDTLAAFMAALAVLPAAVANGINSGVPVGEISLGGPKLLFITLQDVFSSMGPTGPLFGVIFYLLVIIAAVSSAISLLEVIAAHFIDKRTELGKPASRKKITMVVSAIVLVEALIVALDGLGTHALWLPLRDTAVAGTWNADWLDFLDCLSEGIMMPLGAMLMALMVGWELKPEFMLDEIHSGESSKFFDVFYRISIRFLVPLGMALVLAGQLVEFFPLKNNMNYVIAFGVLAVFFIFTLVGRKSSEAQAK